ncbi:MAG: DUF1553 domain-containing protein [Planctomycetota bacterium]
MTSHRSARLAPRRVQAHLLPTVVVLHGAALCGIALSSTEDAAAVDGASVAERKIDFQREVRPILAENCFACHGPDSGTRKADLRLDTHDGLFADRDGVAPVVPGAPDSSEMWLRLTDHYDPMPPTDFDKKVAEDDIETIRTWIEQGAEWTSHWAFERPVRPAVPEVSRPEWVRNAVDAFVLSRLDAAGLSPSPRADRASLLRRVTFDLTGLPPTPEELDAFLADDSEDAYEKVVDRLLASPAYGERMAQEWLDLSRYADSDGDGKDGPRDMWKWRDWVIQSFNDNLPYDQFVVDQIAGDLLPEATLDQKIATGFNRNHFIYTKFGAEKDEYRTAYVVDRVNTTSTVFLGVTMGCAQCHDHKYDPFSQEDYYKLFAFFNNVSETDVGSSRGNSMPRMVVGEGPEYEHYLDVEKKIEELEEYFEGDDVELDAAQAEWEAERRSAVPAVDWEVLEPVGMLSQNGAHLRMLEDGSVLATGPNPSTDTYHLVAQPGARRIVAFRIEALPDESMEEGRSGRSMDGTFSLSEFEVHVRSILEGDDGEKLNFIGAESTVSSGGRSGADGAADGSERSGWGLSKEWGNEPQEAILILEEPLEMKDADTLRFALVHNSSFMYRNTLGRFRISFTDDERLVQRRLPLQPGIWRAVGPFAATNAVNAFAEEFEPEKRIGGEIDFSEKFDPVDLKAKQKEEREAKKKAEAEAKARSEGGAEGEHDGANGESQASPDVEGTDDAHARAVAEVAELLAIPSLGIPSGADIAIVAGSEVASEDASAAAPDRPAVRERAATEDGAARRATGEVPAAQEAPAPKDHPAGGGPAPKAFPGKGPGKGAASGVGDENGKGDAAGAKAPDVAKDEAEAGPGDAPMGFPFGGEGGMRRGRGGDEPEKLTWEEKRDWRLSGDVRVNGRTSAWYLHRTLSPSDPRDVVLRYSGVDGIRVWIDGVVVHDDAPVPVEEPEEEDKSDEKMSDEEEDFSAFFGGGEESEFEDFRFHLEPGEHEVVLKLVTGRTGARANITFQALGRDVAPYEVERAVMNADLDLAAIAASDGEEYESDDDSEFSFFGGDDDSDRPVAERRRQWVREWFRRQVSDEGRASYERLTALRQEKQGLERKLPSVMVMDDREKPRETHVLKRGDYRTPGALVEAGAPSVLPPFPADAPPDRLGLARWITSGDNPLTARVAVNRFWRHYFDRALVTTPGDFGTRGALPTHPELLDWLACEFVESGWDVKAMQRTLVLSNAYRQSSRVTHDLLEVDPENELFARAPRKRLSAELVRDNALAVAGLLATDEVGGKSVKPYQPKGVWEAQSNFQTYRQDKGESLYRRGLYVYWKRATLYPSFEAFDAPPRLTCVVERARTTTPLQSLVLLNDPVYVEAARCLGQRMMTDGGADASTRIIFGFRLCTSRMPTDEELGVLLRILADQREVYSEDEKAAEKLVEVGSSPRDETLDVRELAAWTGVGTVLLNLDATIHSR